MPNGKLEETPVNMACLYLLKEWQKQEHEHNYKIWRLRKLFEVLGQALLYEQNKPELIETPGPAFSLDPMVKQDIDRGK